MSLFRKIKQNLFSIFQTGLVAILIAIVVVFVVVLWSDKPSWIFYQLGLGGREEPKHDTLTFVGLGIGGALIALQALMSYKRAKAMEQTANAQANAVLMTEQGQRQERLKNAIEHLGHERDTVRLGGAYELVHLAEDTIPLRQTVLDILCAHIRRTTDEDGYRQEYKSNPSEEVQSLLTLLFVQRYKVFKRLHVNLQGSWLNGADIREAHLERALLAKAHLQGAILNKAHLQNADFREAHLQGAYLEMAHMQAADFNEARMQGAQLFKACLMGAELFGAHLHGARLYLANLQGARFAGVHLQGADLFQVQLQGVGGGRAPRMFADRIRQQIGKETELYNVIFAGGLSREQVDSFAKDLPDEEAGRFREQLQPHIGQPKRNELPRGSRESVTGFYTEEEAEEWIAEFEKAMSGIQEGDS